MSVLEVKSQVFIESAVAIFKRCSVHNTYNLIHLCVLVVERSLSLWCFVDTVHLSENVASCLK